MRIDPTYVFTLHDSTQLSINTQIIKYGCNVFVIGVFALRKGCNHRTNNINIHIYTILKSDHELYPLKINTEKILIAT